MQHRPQSAIFDINVEQKMTRMQTSRLRSNEVDFEKLKRIHGIKVCYVKIMRINQSGKPEKSKRLED